MNKKEDIKPKPGFFAGNDELHDFSDRAVSGTVSSDLPSMISIIDKDYRYESVNMKFCEAHKKDQHFFIGTTLPGVWGNDVFYKSIKPNIDLCLKGKTVRYEAFFRIAESGINCYEVFLRPVRDSNGQVTHIVAETLDITNIKCSQKRTENISGKTGRPCSDYQDKIPDSRRLETSGVLSGGIAHDLNNILTTIEGYAEMLAADLRTNPDHNEKIIRILKSIDRARSITDQLLLSCRQSALENKNVNVSELLCETLDLLKSTLPSDIHIETDLQANDACIIADPAQIFRIFLNLISNAAQAMEQKGGTLSIKTFVVNHEMMDKKICQKTQAGNYVVISFQDTGRGMIPSVMKRIFEPLYSTREESKASGLGLSIVYELVNGLKGSIFVSSEENIGSVFQVILPSV